MNYSARKRLYRRKLKLSKVSLPSDRKEVINRCLRKIKSINQTIDYEFIHNQKLVWKRALDILFGFIGLVGLVLMYPFIALGIKLSSNAPVIFKQQRTGFDGNEFQFYKFSSMHPESEQNTDDELDITKKDDCRIFAFGKFLRKTNLDELPQFINVLMGDMSLVGPRPYTLHENSYWSSTIPYFHMRYAVKPGLTGLAQATGYRGGTLSLQHMSERLRRDLKYVKKRSLAMDIKLIGLTLAKMVSFRTDAH